MNPLKPRTPSKSCKTVGIVNGRDCRSCELQRGFVVTSLENIRLKGKIDELQKGNDRLQRRNQEIRDKLEHDYLTGILNEYGLQQAFKSYVSRLFRGLRNAGAEDDSIVVTFVYFDLDHFKQVNDTHGHGTGDEALRTFAQILGEHFQDRKNLVGRSNRAGDEFIVILPGIDHDEGIRITTAFTESLRNDSRLVFGGRQQDGRNMVRVGTSGGVDTLRVSSRDRLCDIYERAKDIADQALRPLKQNGVERDYRVNGISTT